MEYVEPIMLRENEWETGRITFREDMGYGSAFVMPHDATLRNINVLFSSKYTPFSESGAAIYPFVCLAVSSSINLVYTILQDTITYTDPYIGGFEYPKHTIRKGQLKNLSVPIREGTLVAIVAGIRAEGVEDEQFGQFAISGGLYFG